MFYQGYYLSTTLSLTKYHRQKYVSLIPSLIHCWEGHISFRSQNPLTRYPSLLLVHHEQPDVRKHSLKIHDACIKIERTLPSEQWKLKREKEKSLTNSLLLSIINIKKSIELSLITSPFSDKSSRWESMLVDS